MSPRNEESKGYYFVQAIIHALPLSIAPRFDRGAIDNSGITINIIKTKIKYSKS